MLHDLILEPCENKNAEIYYDKFALDADFVDNDSVMTVNFICGEQKYYYEVHFNNKSVTYELLRRHPFGALKEHDVFTRTTDVEKGVSTIKWSSKYKLASKTRGLIDNLIQNRTVFGAFQNTNVDIPWMKEIIDWVECYMFPLVLPTPQGLFRDITEQIAELRIDKEIMVKHLNKADIGISDFVIEKIDDDTFNKYEIRFVHNGLQGDVLFDVREESEGTKRYYELSGILMLLVKEKHFVAIDELECRLHPDLYEHFVLTYLKNAKESQIIVTTHSREFLNDRGLFRDDSVWITEKNDLGATNVYSLADFDSDFLRNTTNRYNMYKAGRLGGVPRLQDTDFGN